jgi:DNA-binding PadR family transcriptional regulator
MPKDQLTLFTQPHQLLKVSSGYAMTGLTIARKVDPSFELSLGQLSKSFARLTDLGFLVKIGQAQGARYSLTPKGEAELDRLFALERLVQDVAS